MQTVVELLPKPLALVVLGHAAVSFGAGMVFSDRLAEKVHVPACETALASAAAKTRFSAKCEYERKRRIFEGVIKQFPGLDTLPLVEGLTGLVPGPGHKMQVHDFSGRKTNDV